jgi:hypothetical protein
MRDKARSGWRRLGRALRDDRGDTTQQLMWVLFWLGVIVAAGALLTAWINGKVQQIIGF